MKTTTFKFLIISILGSTFLFGKFSLWSQILVEQTGATLINAHSIRILTTQVLISIPNFFLGTSAEMSFNIICLMSIVLNSILLKKISLKLNIRGLRTYILFSLPYILGAFQNGRGIFLNLSITILTYIVINNSHSFKQILLFILSFLLANFSSGVYFGFMLTYLLLFIIGNNQFIFKRVFGLAFIALNIPLAKIYFLKNLKFYDNSFSRVLEHGILSTFPESPSLYIPISLILVSIAFIVSSILIYNFKRKINTELSFFNFSAFTVLFFGFSAFLAFLPTLLLQALQIIDANNIEKT